MENNSNPILEEEKEAKKDDELIADFDYTDPTLI